MINSDTVHYLENSVDMPDQSDPSGGAPAETDDTRQDAIAELAEQLARRDPVVISVLLDYAGLGHSDPDGWIQASAEHLARLPQPHAAKKRATVIALVRARLNQEPEADVWRQPETCSKTIYYTKWRLDPIFADVLAQVEKAARTWHDETEIRALALSRRRLAVYSPHAAQTAFEALNNPDPHVRLRAAFGILDRAGLDTANAGDADSETQAELDAWRREAERRRQQADHAVNLLDEAPDNGD